MNLRCLADHSGSRVVATAKAPGSRPLEVDAQRFNSAVDDATVLGLIGAKRSTASDSSATGILFVLVPLAALTPLAMNMSLPALPAIGKAFAVGTPTIQMSLSLFLVGSGVGQVVGASVSDLRGRRPSALAGAAIFVLSTCGILLCRSANQLAALRCAQGIGAGQAVVNVWAVIGDRFDTQEAARKFSVLGIVQAAGHLVGPLAGAALATAFAWHSIFWALLAYGASLLLVLWLRLPETVADIPGRRRPFVPEAFASFGRVLGRRHAMAHAVCLSLAAGCTLVVLTDAAFVYMEWFGVGPGRFSLLLVLNTAGFALCNQLNMRLLEYRPPERIVPWACAGQCAATALLLAHVTLMTPALWVVVALILAAVGLVGFMMANATALFLAHFPDMRGTAAGVAGSLPFLVGGAVGTVLSFVHDGTLRTTALGMTLCALLAALANSFARLAPQVPDHPGGGAR